MVEDRVQRRLAAIFAADVAGYSRLMSADEEGTLAAWTAHRAGLIDPGIAEHRGRVVKTTGDGVLAEFASVVDAVRCAVALQEGMRARNAAVPEDRRIALRIGVNLGDVIVQDDDVYGDGVNIAARLEALAEPSGICISGTAYDQIAGKVEAVFEDLGPQSVKNIARPVQVLRLRPSPDRSAAVDVSAPVPGFQARPAIAVLPLENLSGDPDQEFFADGIAEDILTRLAMWRWMPVIARNSSFAYRGRSVDIRQIGRELGARYVLEGSVRKSGNRVRITGQLIDADTGHHVWAGRYDRALDDIFELQDEITDAIVSALEPAVGQAEVRRARLKPPASLDAWELTHRGLWHFARTTEADFAEARALLHRAIERDPDFAMPHSILAIMSTLDLVFAWSRDPETSLGEAMTEAQTAIALDPMEPSAQAALGQANNLLGRNEQALAAGRRSIELNPSYAIGRQVYGIALMLNGQAVEAIESISCAIRISPNDRFRTLFYSGLALAHYTAGDYATAIESAALSLQASPQNPVAHRINAAALAQIGRLDEARSALDRSLALSPLMSEEALRRSAPYRDDADFRHLIDGLRKAGLRA